MTDSPSTYRFRVRRTSCWDDDVQPCPEATKGTYTQHAYCTLPVKKAMAAPNTEWFRKLENQRSAPGGRSVGDRPNQPCWYVDFDGLNDLLAFISKHGSVVVDRGSDGDTIEIYDGYRE